MAKFKKLGKKRKDCYFCEKPLPKNEKLEEDAMKDTDYMKLDRKDNTDCYATWQAYVDDDERSCKK